MNAPGWPHAVAPFHAGEHGVQTRAGTRERTEAVGRQVMRAYMPEQHRSFFAALPFVVLGAPDADGRPWATLLAGRAAGFVQSPDPTHLRVDALPAADDPLGGPDSGALVPGAPVALLGIELPTRRRNRANGRVVERDAQGFGIEVAQSFGNCPKYIQRRELVPVDAPSSAAPARWSARLDASESATIRGADTFFVATHAPGDAPNAGSDVSHRGGRPGFVRVSDDGAVLTWPDFVGNGYFNTLGNLALDPRAGLVFPDFERGDLLHVSGRAEIVWDGAELARFAGAERLVRLHVDAVLARPATLPWRWRFVDASSALDATGAW